MEMKGERLAVVLGRGFVLRRGRFPRGLAVSQLFAALS